MAKLGCGILMLMLAGLLVLWLGYNLFIERQPEFRTSIGGFLFLAGLLYVGTKWVIDGRSAMQEEDSRRKRRRKRKRRRPVDEDDDRD